MATVVAILASVSIALLAGEQVVTGSSSSAGFSERVEGRRSFLASEGLRGALLLGLPPALCAAALAAQATRLARASRRVAAVVLAIFALLASPSIGLFFMPAVVAMIAAGMRD